jgi:gluconate 5-dehydrogenase
MGLWDNGIMVNMLLPGGATITGMIPDEVISEVQGDFKLLEPKIMAEPVIFLASTDSDGITGERIAAIDFKNWLEMRG